MLRAIRNISIIFFVISSFFIITTIMAIVNILLGSEDSIVNLLAVIFGGGVVGWLFYVLGHKQYKKYIEKVKKYGELIKDSNINKIKYRITSYMTVRETMYKIEFFVNGNEYSEIITKARAIGNNNYEYYLEPVYKKSGEFKDFRIHMDKNALYRKMDNYQKEFLNMEEMIIDDERVEIQTKLHETPINKIRKRTTRKIRKKSGLNKKK